MESPFLLELRRHLQDETPGTEVLRTAFIPLDHLLADIATDLQIVYDGPGVGLGTQPNLHRLRVAQHHWTGSEQAWGLAVCSYAGPGEPRSEWRIARASRERLPVILRALPEFFHGYAELALREHPERGSCKRLQEIAHLLGR
ncbi:hypothetical protein [Acidithiobacillus sp. AMEEHan]|uniref:hypothetical protein n=1 Tax=Acidithiobacillus sp. AMEEHan TaxID=2994951 RepID=UPI0027E537AB|nr:hypothetical protein [Acidithiobacillus sp. AMEEHan]